MIEKAMLNTVRMILIALVLLAVSPAPLFASSVAPMDHSSHEMMQMHCADDGACEDQQKRCIEHCLELIALTDQDEVAIGRQVVVVPPLEIVVAISFGSHEAFAVRGDPSIDPRLKQITVQRE